MNKRVSERQILEQNMKSHQEAINEAKAKLAELDKPKVKHGDYGYDGSGQTICVEKEKSGSNIHIKHRNGFGCTWSGVDHLDVVGYTVMGNIFDDLKRYSEDLTEFTMEDDNGDKMAFEIDMAVISLDFEELLNDLTFDKALEMGQKLIRMAYTLKRKNANWHGGAGLCL